MKRSQGRSSQPGGKPSAPSSAKPVTTKSKGKAMRALRQSGGAYKSGGKPAAKR